MLSVGMTGATIIGDILDVSKKPLERALKMYDSQLYLKWNPKKRNGHGIWELRRRPDQKSCIETIRLDGITIHCLDYREIDIVNHIFDVPVLNYELLNRVKKSDTWARAGYDGYNLNKTNQLMSNIEAKRLEIVQHNEQKNTEDLMYNLKQHKSVIRNFKEAILSGTNPADIARYWD